MIGAYQRGSDPRIDAAIAAYPQIMELLRQPIGSTVSMADSLSALLSLTHPESQRADAHA